MPQPANSLQKILYLKYQNIQILFCQLNSPLNNPLTSLEEVVSVFTSPYLSAETPALGEAKGLNDSKIEITYIIKNYKFYLKYE